jgi:deoxyguanosine kinase
MGSGKTTLAKGLAVAMGANPLLEESGRHPFIAEFYERPDSYAIETELSFILLHYHQVIREMLTGVFNGPVVSDFALERDYVFSTLTLKNSEDWDLFEKTYATLKRRIPSPNILIYLQAPVEFLVRRVAQRGRDYEKIITRSYLEAVKKALDHYFLKEYKGQVIVFNAPDLDSSTNPEYVATVISQLPFLHTN